MALFISFFALHHSSSGTNEKAAYIHNGVGGFAVCLSVVIGGENFDSDPCSEPECIHEYFAFVYIRQLGVAIVKFFKNRFLLVRKRFLQIVVMVCDVPHKLFCFGGRFTAPRVRANVSVPQFFKYTSHKLTSL